MRRAWRNDALWPDTLIAAAFGGLCQLGASHDWNSFGSTINVLKTTFYGVESQIFASILGFLIAAAAILATSSRIDVVRNNYRPVYKTLVHSFRDSMYLSLIAVIYSFVAATLDHGGNNAVWFVVALGIFMLVMIRVTRAVRRLCQTLLI